MAAIIDKPDLTTAIDSALEIASRRAQTLGRIRAALESGDDATALRLIRIYCGMEDEQEGHSTSSSVN